MKSIALKKISKSFQTKTLFEDVSFTIQKGDRIAITGQNGAGKSTLLKIIADIEPATSGKLIKENLSCAYIAQEFSGDESLSVMEYLEQAHATAYVFDLLRKFKIISEDKIEQAQIGELSGGQKRVLEIAAVISHGPMFLCIDEPENHLDIKTRSILSEILKQYWGAVLFVSHDRYLINEISNKIIAIQNEQAILMTGKSYEEFQAADQRNALSAQAAWKAEQKVIVQLEDNVRMLKARTRYNDAQAKTYQMKKRQLEKRRDELGEQPNNKKEVKIELSHVQRKTGKLIFSCSDVDFFYGSDTMVLKKLNIELRFGEKVVLLGRNGSGKTTFLKLLQQTIFPQAGVVKVGNDIAIEYVDQTATLDAELSPLEHFKSQGYTEERARSLMSQFVFTQMETEAALKNLSGGQRQRFTFLFLFKTAPECLVLDEPTNNLDPETWELLLHLVNEFEGSLLLVTHDRSFAERLEGKRVWTLQNRTIKESWDDLDTILNSL
jgi:ATPase subunit of ABC transporter with duplicated ATPase domains